jgi:hypothetical protein
LNSAELVLSDIVIDTGVYIDSNGDESPAIPFVEGEIITGLTSGETAVIRAVDLANSRIFISKQNKFIDGEIIQGDDPENASKSVGRQNKPQGKFVSYKPNPIQSIEQLLNYKDIDSTVSRFFINFREEFMATIPNNIDSGVDKRSLIKNITDLYRLKGTSEGHRLFFKMLLNDTAEIYYPSDDILDASGGKWGRDLYLRVSKGSVITDIDTLIGKELKQRDDLNDTAVNEATCLIDYVNKIYNGTEEVLEFYINEESIKGDYISGETVYITGIDGVEYSFVLTSMINSINVTDKGQHYRIDDSLEVVGFELPPELFVNNITSGFVKDLHIVADGTGYSIDDQININEAGTYGQGTLAKISGLHGSIAMEDGIPYDSSLTDNPQISSPTDPIIILEDYTVWLSGTPQDGILFESGNGSIYNTHIYQYGQGYSKMPSIDVDGGTGAKLITNTIDIGGITELRINNPGFNLQSTPEIKANTVLVTGNISGNWAQNEDVGSSSGGTGRIVRFDGNINLLVLRFVSGTFNVGDIITGFESSTTVEIHKNTTASIDVDVSVLHRSQGKAINEDGFISSSAKKIHDSHFYQRYSYLVKTAESIVNWRSSVKSVVHPAGFALFGEINIVTKIESKMRIPTLSATTFTPELFSTFKTIFGSVLRMRIGAEGNGDLNPNPNVVGEGVRDYSIHGHYDRKTRHNYIINWVYPSLHNLNYFKFGSTLKNLEKWKFAQPPYYAAEIHDYPGIWRTDIPVDSYLTLLEDGIDTLIAEDGSNIVFEDFWSSSSNWKHPDTYQFGTNTQGYSIPQFGHYIIKDVAERPWLRTNIPPLCEITTSSSVTVRLDTIPEDSSTASIFVLPAGWTMTTTNYEVNHDITFPVDTNNVYQFVHIDGVFVPRTEYTISGGNVTLNATPPLYKFSLEDLSGGLVLEDGFDIIQEEYSRSVSISDVGIGSGSGSVTETLYNTGSYTYPVATSDVVVFINNIIQVVNYSISGGELRFDNTLSITSADDVVIIEMIGSKTNFRILYNDRYIPTNTMYAITDTVLTYVNGVYQKPTIHYIVL